MNRPADPPLLVPVTPQVGTARPHESAALHVSGRAPYTDDLPELAGTLHAALGLSPVAHGVLRSVDLDRLRALPGVVWVDVVFHDFSDLRDFERPPRGSRPDLCSDDGGAHGAA